MSIKNEFYIHIKNKPKWIKGVSFDKQSRDVQQFYLWELKKVREGITVGGIKFHPWLYWHINHWHMFQDIEQEDGSTIRMNGNPVLRDNEYFINENILRAEENPKKGIFMFGTRRGGKSALISSWTTWNSQVKYGGEASPNTIIGGNQEDLNSITSYIDHGLEYLHPMFKINRITRDWGGKQGVIFGKKLKNNETEIYSRISVLNLNMGGTSSTQKTAGQTPVSWVIDEALEENELLVTNKGFNKIKDCSIGDYIFDEQGIETKIIDKINVGKRQIYEVEFSNGSVIKTCENHLWEVWDKFSHEEKTKVLKTEELLNLYKYGKNDRLRFSVRNTKPVEFEHKNVPVDPYFLGLWLGDGNNRTVSVVTQDEEIKDYINKYALELGMKVTLYRLKNNVDVLFIVKNKRSGNPNPLKEEFKKLNLLENKHIPEQYLFNSKEVRMDLLRGLMDSDGYIDEKGSIQFCNKNEKLINGVIHLLNSLGISFKKKEKFVKGNKYLLLNIISEEPIFKLTRKLNRLNAKSSKKSINLQNYNNIINVKKTDTFSQAYCIKVDNKSNLFLTSNFIVTHNCGKFDFRKSWEAAKPSFDTGLGSWRITPFLMGTSGEIEMVKDAMAIVNNPEIHNLLTMDWSLIERNNPNPTWTRKNWGIFLPGQMSLAVKKEKMNLSKYLDVDDEGLGKIEIDVTPWEEANKQLLDELNRVKKKDVSAYYNRRMFYPLDTDDCFLQDGFNPFPSSEALMHKNYLLETGDYGKAVDLGRNPNTNVIEYTLSDKELPEYPHKGGNIDAPFILFEDPPEPDSREICQLYCGGLDHYKHDTSSGDSLGAFYIVKRKTNAFENDKIVACYVSRPNTMDRFNFNVELLMKLYGAEVLQENADISFQQYLMRKNEIDLWLMNGEKLAQKQINSRAYQNNKYGLTPNVKNIKYVFQLVVDYCWEIIDESEDEDGMKINTYGITRIKDLLLLDEIISYKKGQNHDRILAFGYALAWAQYLDDINVSPNRKKSNITEFEMERKRLMNKVKAGSFYSNRRTGFY